MQIRTFLILAFFVFPLYAVCGAEETISLDAPIQFYFAERTGAGFNEKIGSPEKTKNLFLKQFRIAGLHVLSDLEPPFVSKAMARYGVVRSGGVQSSGIGYVHLQLTDDDKTKYASDSGQEVVLKAKSKSIEWIFDTKKSLEMADKAGAKYAFVVEVNTQLVYEDDSPKPVYNVSLEANLYQADDGKSAYHYSESMVKLASTADEAVLGSCQFLSRKLVEDLQGPEKMAPKKLEKRN
jgi:hypothetical protein